MHIGKNQELTPSEELIHFLHRLRLQLKQDHESLRLHENQTRQFSRDCLISELEREIIKRENTEKVIKEHSDFMDQVIES